MLNSHASGGNGRTLPGSFVKPEPAHQYARQSAQGRNQIVGKGPGQAAIQQDGEIARFLLDFVCDDRQRGGADSAGATEETKNRAC